MERMISNIHASLCVVLDMGYVGLLIADINKISIYCSLFSTRRPLPYEGMYMKDVRIIFRDRIRRHLHFCQAITAL